MVARLFNQKIMFKKTIIAGVMFLTAAMGFAQNNSSEKQFELPGIFLTAQYNVGDTKYMKESGIYGISLVLSSIGTWDKFHVGGNVNYGLNAGLVDPWGCKIDFGPSVRYDIGERCFINMPVDVSCFVLFPEGSTDTDTSWGMSITPTLYGFFTKNFGIFAGPQLNVGFSGGDPTFGFVAGLAFSFN